MAFSILGIGTANPTGTLDQHDAQKVAEYLCAQSAEQATFIPAIYGGSGIRRRFICLGTQVIKDIVENTRISNSPFLPSGEPGDQGPTTRERMAIYESEAPLLGIKASAEALAQSGVLPNEITHLVTVSCTGFAAPGFDAAIINDLGLCQSVERTHVGFMGCHAALNGLRVARAYAESDPKARVLVCSVELCSLHYNYGWDPQKVVANALFADGAGAIVGAASGGSSSAWHVTANGSCMIPEAAEVMTWTIGDHGFGMTLSKKIPEVIGKKLRPWLDEWLAKSGKKIGDIKSWAIHPGGPKILDAASTSIGLKGEETWASREILDQYGNMSSATVIFILKKLMAKKSPLPCVSIGFGPGLNVEVALFE